MSRHHNPDMDDEDPDRGPEEGQEFDGSMPHGFVQGLNAPTSGGQAAYGTKAFAVSSNKPLTSRFRGVCWNKKNKRWQAAINSSGKYLYLGSYDSEEEAARVFDKAAVRIRADKARLNYRISDYVDDKGVVLPDPQVEALLLEACNPTKPRRQRTKLKGDGQGEGSDGGALGGAGGMGTAPPTTDPASADIALQALARLCGPQEGALPSSLPRSLGMGGTGSLSLGMHAAMGAAGTNNTLDARRANLHSLQHLLEGNLHPQGLNRALVLGGTAGGGGASSVPLLASIYQQQQQQHRQNQLTLQANLLATMQQQQQQQQQLLRPMGLGDTLSASFLQDLVSASGGGNPMGLAAAAARRTSFPGMLGQLPQAAATTTPIQAPGQRPPSDLFSTIKSHLPPGAEMDSIIPSGTCDSVVGVLYSLRGSDKTGAGVWNGRVLQSLGMYGSEKDAKQACNGALLIYRDMDNQQHQGGQGQARSGQVGDAGKPGSGTSCAVKAEAACIAPAGWQPDPTACDDPQQEIAPDPMTAPAAEASDESGTQAAAGKRRHPDPDMGRDGQQQLHLDPEADVSGAGAGVRGASLAGPNQGQAKRPRLPGIPLGMATDLSTLQQLANIDVREALHMFFAGKQQG